MLSGSICQLSLASIIHFAVPVPVSWRAASGRPAQGALNDSKPSAPAIDAQATHRGHR